MTQRVIGNALNSKYVTFFTLFQITIGDMCYVSQAMSPLPIILVFLKNRNENMFELWNEL